MDFFDRMNDRVPTLNSAEMKIFGYISKNMNLVKDMSIRELAQKCFVSTTTVLRTVRKMGFEGFREFQRSVFEYCCREPLSSIPESLTRERYSGSYLMNLSETMEVITENRLSQFYAYLENEPMILFYGGGLSKDVAYYAYRQFCILGYKCQILEDEFETSLWSGRMEDKDVVVIFSLNGESSGAIGLIEKVCSKNHPHIVSITKADRNSVQYLSDLNFYCFFDELSYNGFDLSSRGPMTAVVDTIVEQLVLRKKETEKDMENT